MELCWNDWPAGERKCLPWKWVMAIPAWVGGERKTRRQESGRHAQTYLYSAFKCAAGSSPAAAHCALPLSGAELLCPLLLPPALPGHRLEHFLCSDWAPGVPFRGTRGPGLTSGCQLYVGVWHLWVGIFYVCFKQRLVAWTGASIDKHSNCGDDFPVPHSREENLKLFLKAWMKRKRGFL